MKNVKQTAAAWGISERMVSHMCKTAQISGAVKMNGIWQIPDDAQKPADRRIVSGKYRKEHKKKALPVGVSDYIRAQADYYYVDKTLLIRDFLDQRPLVSLFTRPRRFGKTLNMDMLRVFFEISDQDTASILKIRLSGNAEKRIANSRGDIRLSFSPLKT